jgi:hypothetical protein
MNNNFKNKYKKYKNKYLYLKNKTETHIITSQIGNASLSNHFSDITYKKCHSDDEIPDEECLNEIYNKVGCKGKIILSDEYFNNTTKQQFKKNITDDIYEVIMKEDIYKKSDRFSEQQLKEDGFTEDEVKIIYKLFEIENNDKEMITFKIRDTMLSLYNIWKESIDKYNQNKTHFDQTLSLKEKKKLISTQKVVEVLDKLKERYFKQRYYSDKYISYILDNENERLIIKKKNFNMTKKQFEEEIKNRFNVNNCHFVTYSAHSIKEINKYGSLLSEKSLEDGYKMDDEKLKELMTKEIKENDIIKYELSFLHFLMNIDEMGNEILDYLTKLRKSGMLLTTDEFTLYKDHFFDKKKTYKLDRILGANYINKKFNNKNIIFKEYVNTTHSDYFIFDSKSLYNIKAAKHYLIVDSNELKLKITASGKWRPKIKLDTENSFVVGEKIEGKDYQLPREWGYIKGYVHPNKVKNVKQIVYDVANYVDYSELEKNSDKYKNIKESENSFYIVDTDDDGFEFEEERLIHLFHNNRIVYEKFMKNNFEKNNISLDISNILKDIPVDKNKILKYYSDI